MATGIVEYCCGVIARRPIARRLPSRGPAPNRIFTFWEPRDRLTPYLALCKATWTRQLSDFETVVLDHENLQDYVDPSLLDFARLRRLPLMLQKDAVMVAVLYQHGGVFMDIDTIVRSDIRSVIARLQYSEVVMFNTHLAFIAARPSSRLLALWLEGIRGKLRAMGETTGAADLRWDYVGNSELTCAKHKLIRSSMAWRACQAVPLPKTPFLDKIRQASRQITTATALRKHITMLDRDAYGFIAENGFFSNCDPQESYQNFWFDDCLTPEDALRDGQPLIALHNSWTPAWFCALDREAVLSHPCLLSRTLRRVLES